MSDDLRHRAHELGVETSYWDVTGHLHHASDETLRAVVDVLEADHSAGRLLEPVILGAPQRLYVGELGELELALEDGTTLELHPSGGHVALPPDLPIGCHLLTGGDETATVVVTPPTMPRAPELAGGVGLFVPTYALWELDDPLPSFGHLAALAARAPGDGVDVIATLPLYAGFLDQPFDPSPYAPISRLHWNEVYLADDGLPPAPQPRLQALIDWQELARRRRRQLLAAAKELEGPTRAALDAFVAKRPDVAAYARYRTTVPDPTDAAHPPDLVARSHVLAQYLADCQLATIEGPGRATLALDLPIGSHQDGFETWAYPDLFAAGMSVGAPPDEFFADGQRWGLPPQLPGAGRRSGHALWRQLVARAGEHTSMLRIDHVMGVQRLWWIPDGVGASDGVYVRYPREELLATIAAEAHRNATTIVGEDLGTVPEEVIEALARWDMLGLFEEQFHLYHHQLDRIPARSVAGVRTHDMPAFASAFDGDATGGVYEYRRLVEKAVGHPVGDSAAEVLDAALERLAASDAYLIIVDLDDLVGETLPHNVPGQVLQTMWRRRLRQPTSVVLERPDVRRRLAICSSRSPATQAVAGRSSAGAASLALDDGSPT